MAFNVDWSVFTQDAQVADMPWWEYLANGVGWTLALSACAWLIALVLGSIIGTLRTTDRPWVVHLGNAWVELFRNIPLLVQMFL